MYALSLCVIYHRESTKFLILVVSGPVEIMKPVAWQLEGCWSLVQSGGIKLAHGNSHNVIPVLEAS